MTKFRDEFCERYEDTFKLREEIGRVKKKRTLMKAQKMADFNITRVTKGKLGRTL